MEWLVECSTSSFSRISFEYLGGFQIEPHASPQQPQVQVRHSRYGPPSPPRNIPVQLTFPTDYTSVPRFVPVMEYVGNQVNNHSQPSFPQAGRSGRPEPQGQTA